MSRRLLGGLLLVLPTAGPVLAQGETESFGAIDPMELLPEAPTLSGFTKVVAVSSTLDEHVDVLVLSDGDPYLIYSPGIHNAVFPVMDVAYDIVAMPVGGLYTQQAFAMASARGLEIWTFDATTHDFTSSSISLSSSPEALQVCTADLNGTGARGDLLVRTDDNPKRITKVMDPNGTQDVGYFDHTIDVQAVAPIQWTGGGATEMEIAALTAEGIDILKMNGDPITRLTPARSGTIMQVIDVGGIERMAWITTHEGSSNEYLHVADSTYTDTPLDLGQPGVVAATAGDINGDGDQDLVLSHTSSHSLLQLMYDDGFSLDSSSYFQIVVGVSGSAPNNMATPVLTDIDADGDKDVIFPIESTGDIVRRRNVRVDHTIHSPVLDGGEYEWYTSPSPGSAVLRLDVTVPTSGAIIGPQTLVARVWRQDDVSSLMDLAAHRLDTYTVASSGTTSGLEIWLEESYTSNAVFDIELTYLDSAGKPGPTSLWAFSRDKSGLGSLGYGTPSLLTETNVPGGPPDGDVGAGTVPRPCLPCFDDDSQPPEEDPPDSLSNPSNP